MKFSILSVIGRSGAGKGTQITALQEKTGFEIIRTGDLLRQRAQEPGAVGTALKEVLEQGKLVPTPIVFSLWMPILERIKNEGTARGVIFDGNPRKLYEAHLLEEVFGMFGWHNSFRACYIHITEQEAIRRLLERGRTDDTREEIAERLAFFTKEVEPLIDYYRKKNVLVEVNGEQSSEKVSQELTEKLSDFLA